MQTHKEYNQLAELPPVFLLLKGSQMNLKKIMPALFLLILTACTIPVDEPPPPTPLITATPQLALTLPATFTPIPTLAQSPTPTFTLSDVEAPTQPYDFCADIGGYHLIESLIQAFTSKNGALFASLVSPTHGVDVRYYRDGKVINYDVEHAKFVFETTFEADWGLSFGSGEPTIGSFQEIVLPTLQQVFTPASLVVCGQLQIGGATYFPEWPYPDLDFYSVYFPGTEEFGKMDWQTWSVGMDHVAGETYLAALVHYVWEP